MIKKYIPGVIVVEGGHDASKISLLYETVFVITNGYDVPKEEIVFLEALNNDIQIIVLTDKDEAGRKIRERVNEIKQNATNIEIEAPQTKKKKGVAECLMSDIQNELDKYIDDKPEMMDYDLYGLGLIGKKNSKELREIISKKFNLGIVNKNNMIKRLNLLKISLEELKREIDNATSK